VKEPFGAVGATRHEGLAEEAQREDVPKVQVPTGQDAHFTLTKQSAVLHCVARGVPQKVVPALIEDVGRKAVDRVYLSWRAVLAKHISAEQESTRFGSARGTDNGELMS
jgi:hypothetical protein